MTRTPAKPALEAGLWLLLFAGLSPVWVDWGRHLLEEPSARYAAVFVPLSLLLALRQRAIGARSDLGLWCVAGAVTLSLLAVGAGLTRFARPCLALAVMGMALWRGWPRWEVALLSIWWVPVPSFVMKLLERGVASVSGTTPSDAVALPFFALFSGLAWAVSIWRGDTPRRGLGHLLLAGVAGMVLSLGIAAQR